MGTKWRVAAVGVADPRVRASLDQWRKIPGVDLAAVVEIDAPLAARVSAHYGIGHIYPTWSELLAKEDIHFLHVALNLAARPDLVEEAAARGIHCLLEGPMAASLDAADRMLAATRRSRVQLGVNWPHSDQPAYLQARAIVEANQLGQVFHVWTRSMPLPQDRRDWSATYRSDMEAPARQGGGALARGCAAGASLCRALLGVPNGCFASASRLLSESLACEDNALLALQYNFAAGVVESSWTAAEPDGLPDLVVHAVTGALTITDGVLKILPPQEGPPAYATQEDSLAEPPQNAPQALVTAAVNDSPVTGFSNPQVARDAQEILEAGILSMEYGRLVHLPLR